MNKYPVSNPRNRKAEIKQHLEVIAGGIFTGIILVLLIIMMIEM